MAWIPGTWHLARSLIRHKHIVCNEKGQKTVIRFLRRINWKHPNLVYNPKIWMEYFCWCIHFWMWTHKPYYPNWLRKWIYQHWPDAHERWSINQRMIDNWKHINPSWIVTPNRKPLPWFIGEGALGIFVKPWDKVEALFRKHTGGRSHACEFLDSERGALYGGHDGPFMDKMFEQFIRNIDDED